MIDVHGRGLQIVGKLRRVAYHVAEEILRISLQRFQFRIRFADDVRLCLYAGLQKWTQADQLEHLNALQAFQKDDDVAVRHFYGLMHLGQRSEFVEVGGRRILDSRIELRDTILDASVPERVHKSIKVASTKP